MKHRYLLLLSVIADIQIMMPIPSSGGGDAARPAACSVHLLEGEETAKDEGDPGKTNPPHSGWVSYSLFPRPQGECFRRWYFNLVCYNWTAFMISTWFCVRYLIWCSMWKKTQEMLKLRKGLYPCLIFHGWTLPGGVGNDGRGGRVDVC